MLMMEIVSKTKVGEAYVTIRVINFVTESCYEINNVYA